MFRHLEDVQKDEKSEISERLAKVLQIFVLWLWSAVDYHGNAGSDRRDSVVSAAMATTNWKVRVLFKERQEHRVLLPLSANVADPHGQCGALLDNSLQNLHGAERQVHFERENREEESCVVQSDKVEVPALSETVFVDG